MQAFETTDELYFAQQGDQPIEVLTTGRSKITGKDEPLAFVYEYGKGRVFQTLLGHDAASIGCPARPLAPPCSGLDIRIATGAGRPL